VTGKTDYKLDGAHVRGYVRELDLARQQVFKILSTEQGEHIIYPRGFGTRLSGLYGSDPDYAAAVAETRVCAALEPYGYAVSGYSARHEKNRVYADFTVTVKDGSFTAGVEI